MDLHIRGWLITSQPPYPRCQSTNYPERFPEFSPVESSVGEIVVVAGRVKVAATVSSSTIPRESSTQAITIIGKV